MAGAGPTNGREAPERKESTTSIHDTLTTTTQTGGGYDSGWSDHHHGETTTTRRSDAQWGGTYDETFDHEAGLDWTRDEWSHGSTTDRTESSSSSRYEYDRYFESPSRIESEVGYSGQSETSVVEDFYFDEWSLVEHADGSAVETFTSGGLAGLLLARGPFWRASPSGEGFGAVGRLAAAGREQPAVGLLEPGLGPLRRDLHDDRGVKGRVRRLAAGAGPVPLVAIASIIPLAVSGSPWPAPQKLSQMV
ncbi:MAG: hypothetical protein R3B90_12600 [Planctomycetaceae bacterium]